MSDAPQGEGWWLASDGKWYPPEQAPGAAPATPPAPAPTPAGAPAAPGMPTKSSGKGCLIALLVGAFVVLGTGAAALFALGYFADKVVVDTFGGGPCPYLSDEEASDALGSGTTAIETRGLTDVLVVIDARVMPEDQSCALSRDEAESGTGGVGRIARYVGAQARDKYDAELAKANSEAYFDRAIEGIGDGAFCTLPAGTAGAGALVLQDEVLVYVSVVDGGTNCEIAQEIAREVIDPN